MRNLPSIVSNFDSATTGFSDGKIRDNPGDDTGSGVMSAWDKSNVNGTEL